MESSEVPHELTLASSRWANPRQEHRATPMAVYTGHLESESQVDSAGASTTVAPIAPTPAAPHRWIDQVQIVDGKLVIVSVAEPNLTSAADSVSKNETEGVMETPSGKPGMVKGTSVGTTSSGVAVATPKRSKQLTPVHSPHEMDGNEGEISQRDSPAANVHVPDNESSAIAVATTRHDSASSSISVQIKTEDQPQALNPFRSRDNMGTAVRTNAANEERIHDESGGPVPSVEVEVGTDAASSTKEFKANKRRAIRRTNAEIAYRPEVEEEAASDIPSDQADPGFGDSTKARRLAPNTYGYELADWEGKFAPAPVDWEDRPMFADAYIVSRINEWMKDSVHNHHAVEIDCAETREIAPRSWIPEQIESMSPEKFWSNFQRCPDVGPHAKAWWQRYTSEISEELELPEAPEAPIDLAINDRAKLQQTANGSMLSFNNVMLTREKEAKENRRRARAEAKAAAQYNASENPFSPRVNIYLRPAEDDDLPQIVDVYNHYAEKTVYCPEIDPMSLVEMKQWYEDIMDGRLPFLVAVEPPAMMGYRKKNKAKREPERVLGFALADEYHDVHGMYRYTVEVSVYTKPDKAGKGIGGCLFDKILHVLDPHHIGRGGYDFKGDETLYSCGGARIVASILVNIPYISTDSDRLDWLRKWLGDFKFKQVGDLHEIGHKLSKTVNLAIFKRKTGSTIAPWAK